MGDPVVSAGEAGGVVAGAVSILFGIGKGAKWLMHFRERQAEGRARKLQIWHDELDKRERALEEKQSEYWTRIEYELRLVRTQNSALRMAFELVAAPLRQLDPHNPALAQAEQLLHAAFPLDPSVPPNFDHMLMQIDAATKAA